MTKTNRNVIRGGLVILLTISALFAQLSCDFPDTEERIKSGEGDSDAYYMACEFVKKQLIAPGSAEFPGHYKPGVDITFLGNSTYAIRGFVDAQNSFGAIIRTNYYCQLQYVGNDRWRANQVQIME